MQTRLQAALNAVDFNSSADRLICVDDLVGTPLKLSPDWDQPPSAAMRGTEHLCLQNWRRRPPGLGAKASSLVSSVLVPRLSTWACAAPNSTKPCAHMSASSL